MKRIRKTVYTYRELLQLHKDRKVGERVISNVREWLADMATDDDWYATEYEIWTESLDIIGLEDAKINFSGFWSQGDGASFTARVELSRLIPFLLGDPPPEDYASTYEQEQRNWVIEQIEGLPPGNPKWRKLVPLFEAGLAEVKIERTSHQYSHENTCDATGCLYDRGEYGRTSEGHIDLTNWQSRTPKVRAAFDDFLDSLETLRLDLCRAIYAGLEAEYEYLTADEQLIALCEHNEWYFDRQGRRE